MAGVGKYNPPTVEGVYSNFFARRAGIIKALRIDFQQFYDLCDPDLCLYGLPNEQWEVCLPKEEIPAKLPQPVVGINHSREENEWLIFVAMHSDAWLIALASFYGARARFSEADRKYLFYKINNLPIIVDVVSRSQTKEKPSISSHCSNNLLKGDSDSQHEMMEEKDDDDDEDEASHGDTYCSSCGDNYRLDEFWICCDLCERWFHGKCVNITVQMVKNSSNALFAAARIHSVKWRKRTMMMTKTRRPMGTHIALLVETIIDVMSFGFAVIFVKDGSTGSV
ncbi:PHD finger protein ALFIN-LIKE 4-like [Rutidosis leptorrhynchoides]|uniref:PHD finger protein ALFIN-LIKE 4-like n=1 Tax=Rutidosis leptorrhynchoides TaxID=125765 RepID=UPI003A9A5E3C